MKGKTLHYMKVGSSSKYIEPENINRLKTRLLAGSNGFNSLCELICRVYNIQHCCFTISVGNLTEIIGSAGFPRKTFNKAIHQVLSQSKENLLIISDISKDERFTQIGENTEIKFLACVKIKDSKAQLIGELCLCHGEARTLAKSEILSLQLFAKQASQLLEVNLVNVELSSQYPDFSSFEEVTKKQLKEGRIQPDQEFVGNSSALFMLSPLPKLIIDAHTYKIVEVNEAATQQYGYSREELLSLDFDKLRRNQGSPLEALIKESFRATKQLSSIPDIHVNSFGIVFNVELSAHGLQVENRACVLLIPARKGKSQDYEQLLQTLEELVAESNDLILIVDFQNSNQEPRIRSANRAYCSFMGVEPADIAGQPLVTLKDGNYSEFRKIVKSIKESTRCDFTKTGIKQNGEQYWVNFSLNPIIRERGRVPFYVLVGRDISEIKRNEQFDQVNRNISIVFSKNRSLNTSVKQVLKMLVEENEFSAAEMWVVNSIGTAVNKLTSYTGNNQLGSSRDIATRAWISGKEEYSVTEERKNSQVVMGIPLQHHDRVVGILVVELTSERAFRNDTQSFFKTIRNHLGAEMTRKTVEQDLSLLFENAPYILAIAGPDGKFRKVNPAFSKLLGYTERELTSKPFEEFLHPEDRHRTQDEYQNTILGERLASGFVNRYITKSGKIRWISWHSSTLSVDEGLAYAYGRDITPEKKLQSLLDNASKLARIGAWEFDYESGKAYWTSMVRELFQVPEDFQPDLNSFADFYSPEHLEKIKELIRLCREEGQTFHYEAPVITARGNEHWLRMSGEPVIQNGKCVKLTGSFQDIHQIKMVEATLQQSLKDLSDYKSALDQSAIVAITDKFGVIIKVNENFCKISKYRQSELIGKTHKLINSGYHPPSYFKNLWKTISSGKVWRGELKNRAKDGTIYWVDTTIVPFLDSEGKPYQYLAIRFDITKRKQVEKNELATLREKKEILESIGDAFFTIDRSWIITYWNRQAELFMGLPREEVLNKSIWDVLPREIFDMLGGQSQEAMDLSAPKTFEKYYSKENKWFEINVFPSEKGISVYIKDISLRRYAEEAIRESNERFQKVTQATNDAIWDWDCRTDELIFGEGFTKLFGLAILPGAAGIEWLHENIHPEDVEEVKQSFEAAIRDRNALNWQMEYRFKSSTSHWAYVIDRATISRNKKGIATRVVGAISDITDRRNYENSLRILNKKLENRARELAHSNAELEQFAYVASHDLQEPLRMVTSFLTQLQKKYAEALDDKARQYIHFAVDGAKRMRQIILDLLDFSRVGKNVEEPDTVDVNDVVSEVCKLLLKRIQEKNAVVNYKNLPSIKSSRGPLLQIFQNIIGNALKYSKEDVAPVINVRGAETEAYWLFEVEDNGIGIEEEYFEKIFIIFQRLHARDEYEGTGMGLAIVKKTVEFLNGKIWLKSTPGKGTTFYFTIAKI